MDNDTSNTDEVPSTKLVRHEAAPASFSEEYLNRQLDSYRQFLTGHQSVFTVPWTALDLTTQNENLRSEEDTTTVAGQLLPEHLLNDEVARADAIPHLFDEAEEGTEGMAATSTSFLA